MIVKFEIPTETFSKIMGDNTVGDNVDIITDFMLMISDVNQVDNFSNILSYKSKSKVEKVLDVMKTIIKNVEEND